MSTAPDRWTSADDQDHPVVPVFFHLLADFIVLLHVGFVVFVVFGGLLLRRWPKLIWLHLPAVAWGIAVEFAGWICPLTPLEDLLRERAGMAAYRGDFIEHYLLFVLYPAGLTRGAQFLLGGAALVVNAFMYWLLVAGGVRRHSVPTRGNQRRT